MPTLPKVLINQADSKSAGGVALRVRTQDMRYRWFNSAHLMIVLQVVQGDGKTFALDHFLSVLGDLSAHASLEVLRDKSMSYQFSVLPVMMFEEMAGAGKADIDALKAIMTDDKKLL